MESRALIPFLVAMMLLTGVCNTIFMKYQDNQCVRDCDNPDPSKRAYFKQPVLQTAQMFIGEMGCWLVVGIMKLHRRFATGQTPAKNGYQAVSTGEIDADIDGSAAGDNDETGTAGPPLMEPNEPRKSILKGYRVILLALPAICDICGTTLMNSGLLLVAASIYQMTRGALVLFVGLFSVLFLRRRLQLIQWLSLVGVMFGVGLVGLAGAIYPDERGKEPAAMPAPKISEADPDSSAVLAVIGVLLIAGAQIFTASQFVLEEWILENSAIEPIRVVGWEGVFGFIVTVLAMIVMHLVYGRTESGRYGYFDMVEGWRQLTTDREIFLSGVLIMISIGFNFFGLSVTRTVSATSRSTIDTCRTLFIWMVSLGLGWESFKWLQVVGFALLVYSTFLFNGLVQPPLKCLKVDEIEELLPEEPIEHQ